MAQKAGVSDTDSAAPDGWLLNPSVIIIAVCALLVLATAAPPERSTLITVLVVGVVAFVAGRLSASR